MPDVEEPESPAPEGFSCPRCGSTHMRRSAPHSPGERFVRAVSPVHFFRCRSCGHRGWHLGRVGPRRRRHSSQLPARPVEKRDLEALRTRRARTLLALAVAIGLGAATGVVVESCQQRAARPGSAGP